MLAGLFVVAVGLGTLGRRWHGPAHLLGHLGRFGTAGVAAGAAVVVNNLPAASLLSAVRPPHPLALLLGLDLGPNLAVTGSLAAYLWYRAARGAGARPSLVQVTVLGVVLVPLTLAAALATLRWDAPRGHPRTEVVKRSWIAVLALVLLLAPSSSAATRERTIHLPGVPADVVYAAGSVWVATLPSDELLRLDPTSGKVVGRVHLPSVSSDAQLTVADGSVWITDTDDVVYRVDLRTGKVSAKIRLHQPATGVAVGAGSVWVTAPGQSHGTVFRIDPATNRVVERLRTSAGIGPAAFSGGSVWIVDTSGGGRGLLRLDPADDRFRAPPPGLGGEIVAPLAGTSRDLWIAAGGSRFLRYDSRTGKVGVLRLRGAKGATTFAVGPRFVWVASYRDSTLTRIAYR